MLVSYNVTSNLSSGSGKVFLVPVCYHASGLFGELAEQCKEAELTRSRTIAVPFRDKTIELWIASSSSSPSSGVEGASLDMYLDVLEVCQFDSQSLLKLINADAIFCCLPPLGAGSQRYRICPSHASLHSGLTT